MMAYILIILNIIGTISVPIQFGVKHYKHKKGIITHKEMGQSMHKGKFYKDEGVLYLEDINDPYKKSLTNSMEEVLTGVQENFPELKVQDFLIFYKDTGGFIDRVIPTFKNNICTSVEFQVVGFKNIEEVLNHIQEVKLLYGN